MALAKAASRVPTRNVLHAALLGNSLAILGAVYMLAAGITVIQPRYTIYGLSWVFVGLLVLWKVQPRPTDERTRRRAIAIAGVYFVALAAAGGVVVTAMRPGAGEFGLRLATLAAGWGPAPIVSTPWAALVLMPARIVGYLALAYLVYATVIDAAGAAVSGVVGLFSCVSCSWPIVASVLSGVLGGGSAVAAAAFDFSYDISTVVFLLTVALLYWRPVVGGRLGRSASEE
ncbi:DUF7546 family protein [Halobellus clavatus]|jgi:hypothetical protein|uniref:Uncharacterized protein n=1 Tax=Halobellus clavatus TaxID=660517 RepID=A0A1H3K4Q1_9EURY|nr:hypothetical protein [Halobellus clavatus]SDY47170.1 hypothetical protein SAMN04487946_11734 [Halobellus clavatus]